MYLELGRPAEAIASLEEGLRLDPSRPRAHFIMGRARVQLGQKSAAMAEYEILRRLDERLAEALLLQIRAVPD